MRVWDEAIGLYVETARVFGELPYALRRVVSQQLASMDSVHRNIAEGYCSRTVKQYIQSLYFALRSLGESVSGLYACHKAGQLSEKSFQRLDAECYKLENGLLKLVERLEQKRDAGEWVDHLIIKESNVEYGS